MDSSKKYDKPSPEVTANPVSKLFFCWVLPFFKFGYQNDLEAKDIYNATKEDTSGPLGDELERNWDEEVERCKKSKKTPKLLNAIRRTFIKPYVIWGIYCFFQSIVIRMIQPIVLADYIRYFDKTDSRNVEVGWALGCGVIFISFMNVLTYHHVSVGCQRIGMRCRIACCSLIYRKLLKLNTTSLGQTAAGQLINLLSNDVQRFDTTSIYLHYIWIMPIQTVIAAYIMYQYVGVAAFAGLIVVSLQAIPLQGYLSKLQGKYRKIIAEKTDKRVKLMSEITSGIQVIKMYAWEKPFEKMVEWARKHEIDIVTKTSYIRGFSVGLMVFTERAILYIIIITYVLLGNRLTGDVVFSLAQLINTIQLYMCIFYPQAVTYVAETKVSIQRIEDFLVLEEKEEIEEKISADSDTGKIVLTNVNASWIPNPIVETLMNIDVTIKPGTLCCVVGKVGAGKSSLLQLLLKELPVNSGKLIVNGNISFASQEPWLFVSSVRNNILFGQTYQRNRYKDVVKVCALERDFELFPHGDKTLVGERGVSLSGGQRARINLARSVYREADIYLFDDPLSAVDTHVGKHLFEECMMKYLNGKTRILVTHQIQFLKQADLIVVISNGKIEKVGTFNELSTDDLIEVANEPDEKEKVTTTETEQRPRLMSVVSHASTLAEDDDDPQETQELIEKGSIPASVYMEYYRAGGGLCLVLFLAFLLIIAQAASNASDLWLTYWTNIEGLRYMNESNIIVRDIENSTTPNLFNASLPNSITKNSDEDTITVTSLPDDIPTTLETLLNYIPPVIYSQHYYIYIYSVFIAASIILTTARSLLFFKICMNASKGLHNKMFSNVLQATMRFFDTNPSGRILNRFSKDMGAIDEILPMAAIQAIQIFLVMSGILFMVFYTTPWMMAPAVFLGALFCWFRVVYLASAQDVKRLEGTTRAPVFSHLSATLYGISTIRSAGAQNMITNEFDALQDTHTGAWFLFAVTSEAFGLYLDVISTCFLALVTFQFLVLDDGSTKAGDVGLVISQSLILSGMLQYGVRQTAEVSSNMTSVERVLQYTKLDKEGPFESLSTMKPKSGWPFFGKVSFKNLYLKYIPDGPPVLKNLNIDVQPGEKVGIVGRTGAGKSTLISALFRLAPTDGEIKIDDINTKEIGLNDLRGNISIIPQEPVLFSATLRYNLDPFEKCSDENLWKALENVKLKDTIDDLGQSVSEGGANFSAGQRQLLCLARAIVRNNKILVMDEATANVDPGTDALIQETIRKEFKDCTVFTIAHRLNTVMDSDKVLVMDAGQAMEFDHPHILLQKPDGIFTGMVKQTGPKMDAELRTVAQNDYNLKYTNKETIVNGECDNHSTEQLNGIPNNVETVHENNINRKD